MQIIPDNKDKIVLTFFQSAKFLVNGLVIFIASIYSCFLSQSQSRWVSGKSEEGPTWWRLNRAGQICAK